MCLCVYVYAGVATAVTAGICMLVFATNMFWQPLFPVILSFRRNHTSPWWRLCLLFNVRCYNSRQSTCKSQKNSPKWAKVAQKLHCATSQFSGGLIRVCHSADDSWVPSKGFALFPRHQSEAVRTFAIWTWETIRCFGDRYACREKLWTPVELTNDPHWHWCGTHRLITAVNCTTQLSFSRGHLVISQ